MIVIDIETSGSFNPQKNGIWQIGALELENPENIFLQEARIDDEDNVEEGALKVTGKTESELRDKNKQSQKDLLKKFFEWASKIKNKIFIAHNASFDYGFIVLRAKKYNLEVPFHHRTLDLHSIAFINYYLLNRKFAIKQNYSNMGLYNILGFCGIPDKRIRLKDNKVEKKGTPHNALEDAKLTAECFSRMVFKRSLLPEFSQNKLPSYLIK